MSQLDPDGPLDAAPLSAIPPATRMAVAVAATEGDRGPRPATSLIDIKQQSDRVRVAQRSVEDQTNDSDDADELSPRLKRNNATFQNINSPNQMQDTSPNMPSSSSSSLAALPQGSSTPTPTPTPSATPNPAQHPNVRRTVREGGSSRTSGSRRGPKESGSATTGSLPTIPSDPPRERRPKRSLISRTAPPSLPPRRSCTGPGLPCTDTFPAGACVHIPLLSSRILRGCLVGAMIRVVQRTCGLLTLVRPSRSCLAPFIDISFCRDVPMVPPRDDR